MTELKPLRGDIWLVNLNPVKGREQAGKRPCLVVSADLFNRGPSELVVVLPITSKDKEIPFHVEVSPPEGGLKLKSFIKCEDVRSISLERFSQKLGVVSTASMTMVEERLRILFCL